MPNRTCVVVFVFAVAALGAIGTSATPQSPSARADSDTVVALEHTWLVSGDSATLERILAPDFLHPVFTGNILDKSEHIAFVAKHPRPASVHPRFERLDVRVYGSTAVATGIVAATQDGTTGMRRTVFTDVFVERDGRWQAVSAQETVVAPR
ncbi:MAG TPA: nuclear transport factor 2 family protein [Gemmatimonadaceae bacterium]|nr:nuclear transport factor 2 family protein [Gemmatimonadaceae bacterium]